MNFLKTYKRRGFNLVEAAIVLGVVGLVIGGIWVAAAEVQKNRKLSVAATSIGQAVEAIRSVFKNMPVTDNAPIDIYSIAPHVFDPLMVKNGRIFLPPLNNNPDDSDISFYFNNNNIVAYIYMYRNDCKIYVPYLASRLKPANIYFEGSESTRSYSTFEQIDTLCSDDDYAFFTFPR